VLRRNAPTPVQQVRSASTRAKYVYNGLNWRILKQADTNASGGGGDAGLDQQRIMFYSANWQLLQEFIDDDSTFPSGGAGQAALAGDNERRMQYLWGPRYIDDIVLRRLDGNADGDYSDSGTDKVYFHCTDAMFSTVEVLDDAAVTLERVSYDPYGQARWHKRADCAIGEGGANIDDLNTVTGHWGSVPAAGDVTRDGNVNIDDLNAVNNTWGAGLALGKLSLTDNQIGWDGYVFNAECDTDGMYTVRHRHYKPGLGRWIERDPALTIDGLNLYQFADSRPVLLHDSFGLQAVKCRQGAAYSRMYAKHCTVGGGAGVVWCERRYMCKITFPGGTIDWVEHSNTCSGKCVPLGTPPPAPIPPVTPTGPRNACEQWVITHSLIDCQLCCDSMFGNLPSVPGPRQPIPSGIIGDAATMCKCGCR
jgi:RHS repeat-associated protein